MPRRWVCQATSWPCCRTRRKAIKPSGVEKGAQSGGVSQRENIWSCKHGTTLEQQKHNTGEARGRVGWEYAPCRKTKSLQWQGPAQQQWDTQKTICDNPKASCPPTRALWYKSSMLRGSHLGTRLWCPSGRRSPVPCTWHCYPWRHPRKILLGTIKRHACGVRSKRRFAVTLKTKH